MNVEEIAIRRAEPGDAAAFLEVIRGLLCEPGVQVPLQPDEFEVTVDQQREIFTKALDSSNSVYLLAECGGRIVGQLSYKGGMRRAMRHSAILGMSVCPEWRGRGVGALLMEAGLDWARSALEITRLELFVYADNAAAIRLYQKFGFEVEGCRKGAILHEGRFVDDLIMARMFSREGDACPSHAE